MRNISTGTTGVWGGVVGGGPVHRGEELGRQITESCEFDRLDGKVMKSTGSTDGQQDFGEEQLVEDLFTEVKDLFTELKDFLDISTESSEFDRLGRKHMGALRPPERSRS